MTVTSAEKERLLARFNCNPPADVNSLRQVEAGSGIRLPQDYARFLQDSDGGEGFVGNAYLILWRAGELLEMNNAYQVREYAPGLFLFGSDGGGEAFAFDTRVDAQSIVSVPFVGMDLKLAREVAQNFEGFLEELSRS